MKRGKKCKYKFDRYKMLPARTRETIRQIDEKIEELGEELEDLWAIKKGLLYEVATGRKVKEVSKSGKGGEVEEKGRD